jgi:hypothetical protein
MSPSPPGSSEAVATHKYRSENLVPSVNSKLTYPDLLVCPHNGPGRKLVAAVVDFACAGFDDSHCGRLKGYRQFLFQRLLGPYIG